MKKGGHFLATGISWLPRKSVPRCYRVDESISGELNFKVFAVRISVY
jgi:hypothetical protein